MSSRTSPNINVCRMSCHHRPQSLRDELSPQFSGACYWSCHHRHPIKYISLGLSCRHSPQSLQVELSPQSSEHDIIFMRAYIFISSESTGWAVTTDLRARYWSCHHRHPITYISFGLSCHYSPQSLRVELSPQSSEPDIISQIIPKHASMFP